MRRTIDRLIADESGATAIEYGLIVSLVSVAILAVLGTIGINLLNKFQDVADALFSADR